MTSKGGPPDDNAKRMMKRFAETTVRRNVQHIKDEFTAIQEHSTQNVPDHSTFSKHPDRNRYQSEFFFPSQFQPLLIPLPIQTDIFCTESTRVKLNWPQGTKDDYIHANWIKGFPELDKTLIATQAPTQSSIGDFWRMVGSFSILFFVANQNPITSSDLAGEGVRHHDAVPAQGAEQDEGRPLLALRTGANCESSLPPFLPCLKLPSLFPAESTH
jgi:hypothetical protein